MKLARPTRAPPSLERSDVFPLAVDLVCSRDVATIPVGASPFEAAERMGEAGVGSLVVLNADGAPVGMVTDRDLALRVVTRASDPEAVQIGDVMTEPLVSVKADDSAEAVSAIMKRSGIRRVTVLSGEKLVGIVALDDLLRSLALEVDDLGKETRSKLSRVTKDGDFDVVRREIDRRLHEVSSRMQFTNWIARDKLLREVDELRQRVLNAAEE